MRAPDRIARFALLVGLGGCDVGAESAPTDVEPATAPVVAGEAEQVAADRHVGRFRFSGGEAERTAVHDAIEEVVAEMNLLARGIARGRLREANRVPERIEIRRDGDTLVVLFDERRYAAPLDGTPVDVTGITGDTLRYRVAVTNEHVRQHFAGDSGGRENTLRRHGDDGLKLHVKVTSASLPTPLLYRLSFRSEPP